MMQQGDGSLQRRIVDGLCPKCEVQMKFNTDGLEEDYMSCPVCKLVMVTPRTTELEILVELES
jgi:hypothetical protein